MAKRKHIKTTIEINGKTYDARTGKQVDGSGSIRPPAPRQSIDGVIGKSQGPPARPAPGGSAHPKSASRPSPRHAKRQAAKSHTLMRGAVQKPAAKRHGAKNAAPESIIQHDLIKRSERAKQIQKSRLVQHFNADAAAQTSPSAPEKSQPLPPAEPKQPEHPPHPPARQLQAASHSIAARPKHPTIKDFEQAVQNATSHLEKMPAKARRRRPSKAGVALASVAALLLIGFFGWQNTPNLQMRLAASRADIPAGLPGYSPAGYSVDGGIRSEPGKVTVSFRSDADGKSYYVTEQASDWNDSALFASYVEPRQGQIYPSNDKKIYLIDNSSATWVDGGIWYRVEGTANLTADQLGRIANSL